MLSVACQENHGTENPLPLSHCCHVRIYSTFPINIQLILVFVCSNPLKTGKLFHCDVGLLIWFSYVLLLS